MFPVSVFSTIRSASLSITFWSLTSKGLTVFWENLSPVMSWRNVVGRSFNRLLMVLSYFLLKGFSLSGFVLLVV